MIRCESPTESPNAWHKGNNFAAALPPYSPPDKGTEKRPFLLLDVALCVWAGAGRQVTRRAKDAASWDEYVSGHHHDARW
jgi:hypothetical protein